MLLNKRACRFGEGCTITTYEEAGACLGQHSERTINQVTTALGLRPRYLQNALSPTDNAHSLRADLVGPLTREFDNPVLLKFVAESAGYGIYRLPSATATTADALRELVDVMDAVGLAARELKQRVDDGRITFEDAEQISERFERVIRECTEGQAVVKALAR